jgi:hypothetical protein
LLQGAPSVVAHSAKSRAEQLDCRRGRPLVLKPARAGRRQHCPAPAAAASIAVKAAFNNSRRCKYAGIPHRNAEEKTSIRADAVLNSSCSKCRRCYCKHHNTLTTGMRSLHTHVAVYNIHVGASTTALVAATATAHPRQAGAHRSACRTATSHTSKTTS